MADTESAPLPLEALGSLQEKEAVDKENLNEKDITTDEALRSHNTGSGKEHGETVEMTEILPPTALTEDLKTEIGLLSLVVNADVTTYSESLLNTNKPTEGEASAASDEGCRVDPEGEEAKEDNSKKQGGERIKHVLNFSEINPYVQTFSENEENGLPDSTDGQHQPPPTPTFDSDQEVEGDEPIQSHETLKDGTSDPRSSGLPTGAIMPFSRKRLHRVPVEGVHVLKPQATHPPSTARGQVRGQQITSVITVALPHRAVPSPKQPTRSRRPANYIRLATVTVSAARLRTSPYGPSLYYEAPKRPKKVITWEEATNARPPLRIDMEGPTACTYSPRAKPPNETNAPAFTFGTKCYPEKAGGSRTCWSKTWFQTPHVWYTKVDFIRDTLWPSPNQYDKASGIGPRQRTMPEAPSFTFGHKSASFSIARPSAPEAPSPNEYKRHLADKLVLPRAPSFTHQLRREGTVLWGVSEVTPGPAAYSPKKPSPEPPSFTIQGVRRVKSHLLGPYSPL